MFLLVVEGIPGEESGRCCEEGRRGGDEESGRWRTKGSYREAKVRVNICLFCVRHFWCRTISETFVGGASLVLLCVKWMYTSNRCIDGFMCNNAARAQDVALLFFGWRGEEEVVTEPSKRS